jgi:YfiR/HmsC-like
MNGLLRKNFTWRLAAICLLLWAVISPLPPARADGPSREYQLKAAFLYNFAQFVDWPEESFANNQSPLIVAVVGQDPFNGALDQVLKGKTAGGRGIVVKYFANSGAIESCHVLFVSSSEQGQMSAVLQRAGKFHALTVGDFDGFTASSGMIRFFAEDNRLRFEINTDAVAADGKLKIRSQLLKLARIYGK